ncbi:hypothetical protein KN1_11910 [Stygiolobus caldivivus]|uniref:Uncharacterized protein n=1 Tax=Stygiolobus caldivivus TaxID=2824673 RepID=A0A8D5U6T4_9CREN|nr:hypothetical protein KN1_11910 [Stygiolobus caldivivus]
MLRGGFISPNANRGILIPSGNTTRLVFKTIYSDRFLQPFTRTLWIMILSVIEETAFNITFFHTN